MLTFLTVWAGLYWLASNPVSRWQSVVLTRSWSRSVIPLSWNSARRRGVDKKLFSLAGTGGPGSEEGGGQWVSDKNPVGAVFTSMAPNGVNVAQERDGVILVGFPDTPGGCPAGD